MLITIFYMLLGIVSGALFAVMARPLHSQFRFEITRFRYYRGRQNTYHNHPLNLIIFVCGGLIAISELVYGTGFLFGNYRPVSATDELMAIAAGCIIAELIAIAPSPDVVINTDHRLTQWVGTGLILLTAFWVITLAQLLNSPVIGVIFAARMLTDITIRNFSSKQLWVSAGLLGGLLIVIRVCIFLVQAQ